MIIILHIISVYKIRKDKNIMRKISNLANLNNWGWTNLNQLNIIATFSIESIANGTDNSYHSYVKYAVDPKQCYQQIRNNSVSPFNQFNCFIEGYMAKDVARQMFDKYNKHFDFTTSDVSKYAQVTYFCIDEKNNLYQICKAFYDINK